MAYIQSINIKCSMSIHHGKSHLSHFKYIQAVVPSKSSMWIWKPGILSRLRLLVDLQGWSRIWMSRVRSCKILFVLYINSKCFLDTATLRCQEIHLIKKQHSVWPQTHTEDNSMAFVETLTRLNWIHVTLQNNSPCWHHTHFHLRMKLWLTVQL